MRRPVCDGELSRLLCKACGAPLSRDETGISKRLLGRGITQFYCIPCLAVLLGVERHVIRMKIEEFRSMGCALFPKRQED